ncbi:hypothetical protein LX88_000577 [Lentzea californiensis]|nr:hypothetical protein [Lentzea californiensis]
MRGAFINVRLMKAPLINLPARSGVVANFPGAAMARISHTQGSQASLDTRFG